MRRIVCAKCGKPKCHRHDNPFGKCRAVATYKHNADFGKGGRLCHGECQNYVHEIIVIGHVVTSHEVAIQQIDFPTWSVLVDGERLSYYGYRTKRTARTAAERWIKTNDTKL
jgi:hypothetical protein